MSRKIFITSSRKVFWQNEKALKPTLKMTLHFLWSLVLFLAELPNLLRQLFGLLETVASLVYHYAGVREDNSFALASLSRNIYVEFLQFSPDFDLNDIVKCLRNTFEALKNAGTL